MEKREIKRVFNWVRDTRTDHPQHEFDEPRGIMSKADLRSKLPAVYDQGELGSCTANALGAAYQYDQINHRTVFPGGKPFVPSRLFVYYNEREMEGTIRSDEGAAIEDGVKSVSTAGVCPEEMWPYDISKFAVKPPADAYKFAKNYKVTKCKKIRQTLGQLRTSLFHGYPIVFGMMLYESFKSEEVSTTGKMPMPKKNETCLGGHAVLICGYDDVTKMFLVRNSWGESWGDKGYFYVPYEYILSDQCSDFWVLIAVTRDLPDHHNVEKNVEKDVEN